MKQPNILLIYTGGTIGMIEDYESKALRPFDFESIENQVPEIKKIEVTQMLVLYFLIQLL